MREQKSEKSSVFGVFIILYIIWLMLTNTTDISNIDTDVAIQEAIMGLFVSAIVTFMVKNYVSDIPRTLKSGVWFLLYIPYFLWLMIKANLDVAYRVLHPALPIKPGIVEVKTKLKSDVGKLALANSITLTPGTLTMDVVGDRLYIHCINVGSESVRGAMEEIVTPFEVILRRIYP